MIVVDFCDIRDFVIFRQHIHLNRGQDGELLIRVAFDVEGDLLSDESLFQLHSVVIGSFGDFEIQPIPEQGVEL